MTVEHRYRTNIGMSFDLVLRQGLRQKKGMEFEVQRYKTNYCIPDYYFLKSPRQARRRRRGQQGKGHGKAHQLRARRRAPTGPDRSRISAWSFTRRGVDRLVSFCGDGVKKTSP